jgi:hypothetical protein
MSRMKRFAGLAMVFLVLGSTAAYAQQAPLTDDQVQQRLGFITKALQAGQPAAQRWWYGWIGAYTVGAIAGGILAGSHWNDTKVEGEETTADREFAEGMLVGGGTFVLGVGGLLIDPFTPATAARKLDPLPEATPADRLAKLERAEELLRKCAARERRGRSLTTHLLNVGGNAAGAVVVKAVFHQSWGSALVTFASGEAVSLLNIFTQPMRAVRDLKAYETGFAGGPSPAARPETEWSLGFGPGRVSFSLRF